MNAARRTEWVVTAGAIAVALAVLTGCDETAPYRLYFSHYTHVTKYEAACVDCHGQGKDGRFAAPAHAACVDCHEDWMDKKSIGEKTCGQCHKKRDLKELGTREPPEPAAPAAGVFVHTESLSNRCDGCHGNLMGEKMTEVPRLARSDVIRMRNQSHRGGEDCAACHADMDPRTPPPDHRHNWTIRHGLAGAQPDNACAVCHDEQSCRSCHQETMPVSHNNLWRLKTHGIMAAWDRSRCQVCHEEDSCVACHAETRPQSHTANWRSSHCQRCHPSSATGTGCTFCHEGGIDAHPNPHPAGWRSGHCTGCHPGTPQGEQCKVCHGDAGLDSHPNPHNAGWKSRHCAECHEGRIHGVRCEACHGANLLDGHPNPHAAGWERTHCKQCHAGASGGASCESCHGGDILGRHPNPHPAGFRQRHCYTCHPGAEAAAECAICHEGGSSVLVHEDSWPPVHNRFGDKANCYDCHHP